jgi:hypothetical protein
MNTNPIFIGTPNVQWAKLFASSLPTGSHNACGTLGTDIMVAYSASANGSRIDEVKIVSLGTNNPTIVRLFVNNGLDNTIPTNNSLIDEVLIAGTTISENTNRPVEQIFYTNGLNLGASHRLLAVTSVSQSAGLHITAFGGDY